jgi:hypothetical protein
MQMQPGTFGYALEMVSNLPAEQQEELIQIVRKRLSEQRRAEIAREAADALQAVREGRYSTGTVADLMRELKEEDD